MCQNGGVHGHDVCMRTMFGFKVIHVDASSTKKRRKAPVINTETWNNHRAEIEVFLDAGISLTAIQKHMMSSEFQPT